MKKSEMVKKIVSIQESFYHRSDERFTILAKFILNEMIENGMLPPEATVEEWIDCGDGQRFEVNTKHAWEKE
jgi:hypothetical protein